VNHEDLKKILQSAHPGRPGANVQQPPAQGQPRRWRNNHSSSRLRRSSEHATTGACGPDSSDAGAAATAADSEFQFFHDGRVGD